MRQRKAWGEVHGGYIIAKEAAWLCIALTFVAGMTIGFLIAVLILV